MNALQTAIEHKDLLLTLLFCVAMFKLVFAETFGNGNEAFYAELDKSEKAR